MQANCFLASVLLDREAFEGAEFEKKKVRFGSGQVVTDRKFTNHRMRNDVAVILVLPQIRPLNFELIVDYSTVRSFHLSK